MNIGSTCSSIRWATLRRLRWSMGLLPNGHSKMSIRVKETFRGHAHAGGTHCGDTVSGRVWSDEHTGSSYICSSPKSVPRFCYVGQADDSAFFFFFPFFLGYFLCDVRANDLRSASSFWCGDFVQFGIKWVRAGGFREDDCASESWLLGKWPGDGSGFQENVLHDEDVGRGSQDVQSSGCNEVVSKFEGHTAPARRYKLQQGWPLSCRSSWGSSFNRYWHIHVLQGCKRAGDSM